MRKYRAIQIKYAIWKATPIEIIKFIWGADIWLGNIPFMKSLILANIIVWAIMWATR
jgi:hypothetical protein